jgi:hypothetical protein
MEALIPLVLSLIQHALPLLGGSAPAIAKVVDVVVAVTPTVISTYKDLKPIVTNIVQTLKSDPATARAQIEKLEAVEAQLDADFDDAADKALADDKAASD